MRILHLYRYCFADRVGGIERHLADLAGACAARGAEVTLLVSHASVWPQQVTDERRGAERIIRLPRLPELWSGTVSPAAPTWIRALDADLVHLHWPHLMALGVHRAPLVLTYHNDVVRQRWLMPLFQPALDGLLERAARIIVTSQQNLDTSAVLAPHRDKCVVVPYGIRLEAWTLDGRPELARRRDEIRARCGGGPLALFVGRLVGFKGVDDLLEAWTEIPAHLAIVGDGPERAALAARASRGDLAGRVTFAGVVRDELPAYYHAADLLVLPSRTRVESFGLVQAEAQACGLPLVSTRVGTGVEYVNVDGETGMTVPPGDVRALRAAVRALLEDAPRRAAFGDAGRKRAHALFSCERMAERTMEVYAEVLGAGGGDNCRATAPCPVI